MRTRLIICIYEHQEKCMTTFVKAMAPPGAHTLPGRYYASQEVFREEVERIFYSHWVCVGRANQIPNPGDYFLAQIADESLIIVRGRNSSPGPGEGAIRAFFN